MIASALGRQQRGDITTRAITPLLGYSTPEEFWFTSTDFNSYAVMTTVDGTPRREQEMMGASMEIGPGITPH